MDLHAVSRDDAPRPQVDVHRGESEPLPVETDGAHDVGGGQDRRRMGERRTLGHVAGPPRDSTIGVAFCDETKITASESATTSCSSPGAVNR